MDRSAGSDPGPRRVYFDAAYTGAAHAFDTTRKARAIADLVPERGSGRMMLVEPPTGALAEAVAGIERLHTRDYVTAIRTGQDEWSASSQGFDWDPGIWEMAVHSTAGVIAATDDALAHGVAGSLSSGLHHARTDSGAGYCTVNGLVIAAHRLADEIAPVAILDLDAHCGGGTAEMLDAHGLDEVVRHYDLAVDPFDLYEPVHREDRFTLVSGDDVEYLEAVGSLLDSMPWSRLRIVLYNAGMDPHPPISRLALAIRERMVFERAAGEGVPIAWVLAGGYTSCISMDELVDLHWLTLDAAAAPHEPATADVGARRP